MTQLKDQISEDIKSAMKAKDKIKLNVLRYLKKLFIENDTSKKPQNEMDIIVGHQKKIKESIESDISHFYQKVKFRFIKSF